MSVNTALGTQQYHGKTHPHTDHTFTGTKVVVGADGTGTPAEIDYDESATATTIPIRDAAGQVNVPTTPTAANHAVSKQHFDQALATGTTWKELLLHANQLLNGGAGGILPAILAYVAVNPAAADFLTIEDGVAPETFTFQVGASAGFGVQVQGTAALTQTELVQQINAASLLWSAVEATGLDDYFAGAPTSAVLLYRKATTALPDRVFGTIAGGQAGIKVVEFATGDQDYRNPSGTESDLPSVDPAAKRFGFGRVFASLVGGMTHRIVDDNSAFTWDADDTTWRQTDVGALSGGDGIDLTNNVVKVDLDPVAGLEINAAKLRAKTDESTIERGLGSLRVKDSGITLAKLADMKAEIALAGTAPVLSDLASLTTAGHFAFAKGTGDEAYLCYALGAGPKKFAVQFGEITV